MSHTLVSLERDAALAEFHRLRTGPTMPKVMLAMCVNFFTFASVAAASDEPARIATDREIAAIRDSLQTKLKDADSAKFLNVRVKGSTACGQINAKNSYGAYSGFQVFNAFVVVTTEGKTKAMVLVIDRDDSDVAARACAKSGL
jgi:hypothetical protein